MPKPDIADQIYNLVTSGLINPNDHDTLVRAGSVLDQAIDKHGRLKIKAGAERLEIPVVDLKVSIMRESRGISWWAGFPAHEPIAVSDRDPEDAKCKALETLRRHGWKSHMSHEVGMLLILNYERGRADQQMCYLPDYVTLTAHECDDPVQLESTT